MAGSAASGPVWAAELEESMDFWLPLRIWSGSLSQDNQGALAFPALHLILQIIAIMGDAYS